MLIQLERLDDAFNLKATNEQGNSVETDAAPAIGGGGKGMRPMEMLLSSLGACSSIDVIDILRKMRQPLNDIKVTLNGEREKDKTPSLFTDIHVTFNLYGDLDLDKAKRAVDMSMEKYCSVAKILEKTAKITWETNVLEG
ncbi:MAG: OsmC family protein [Haliscomenobacter sp.]|uniref:OsmC family protein n=1 Tax=Haliscomenobacter sp. TaxID=2717303 RepID=UPI0029A86759|nr:OsmC family protein [Haliscomenobacter sp.]MDX2068401.1 OsmC family protein [Haliscomenobacter sp.]